MNITESILLKAGFKQTSDKPNTYKINKISRLNQFDEKCTIELYVDCYKCYHLLVYSDEHPNMMGGMINTIEAFNKAMETMKIDFKIKEPNIMKLLAQILGVLVYISLWVCLGDMFFENHGVSLSTISGFFTIVGIPTTIILYLHSE